MDSVVQERLSDILKVDSFIIYLKKLLMLVPLFFLRICNIVEKIVLSIVPLVIIGTISIS